MKYYIARDKSGMLYLYNRKPNKLQRCFDVRHHDDPCFDVDEVLFPDITFENSPIEVEIKIKGENK